MKRIPSIVVVLLACITVCPAHKSPVADAAPLSAVQPSQVTVAPVIVRLVGRNKTITISAGPGHALYSATDDAGKIIVSNATLDELKTTHPDIYQRVSPDVTAYAGL